MKEDYEMVRLIPVHHLDLIEYFKDAKFSVSKSTKAIRIPIYIEFLRTGEIVTEHLPDGTNLYLTKFIEGESGPAIENS